MQICPSFAVNPHRKGKLITLGAESHIYMWLWYHRQQGLLMLFIVLFSCFSMFLLACCLLIVCFSDRLTVCPYVRDLVSLALFLLFFVICFFSHYSGGPLYKPVASWSPLTHLHYLDFTQTNACKNKKKRNNLFCFCLHFQCWRF